MSQPIYLSSPVSYPMNAYPSGPAAVSPAAWQGHAPQVFSPSPPRTAWAPQPQAPRPIIRAKGPDEPPATPVSNRSPNPAPISIPTPEQMGVASAPAGNSENLDWTATHHRLEKLGAVCFRMDQLESGGCRFTCLLPTRQSGVTHRVEAEAPTSTEAARIVLGQAEEWSRTSK
jgi:hypothetical protein